MPEDERTKLRRECQEDLDALRGVVEERVWVLLERIIARLTRIEVGTFPASEENTNPARRSATPSYVSAQRRHDSVERWTADGVKGIFEEARKDPPKEGSGE